jgi:membrane-bound lytic murein transglycosylase D
LINIGFFITGVYMSAKRDISNISSPLILCLLLSACAGNSVKDNSSADDILSDVSNAKPVKLSKIPKAGPLIKVSYQSHPSSHQPLSKANRYPKPNNESQHPKSRNKYDTWDRIFSHFRLGTHRNNPRVKAVINEYARKPQKLAVITQRSIPYLHMIVAEVERRGMPSEIALLPFVESGFNPKAYSHSGAAGLWQFIPSTGKIYGLPRNHQFDARLDPFAATHAALNYLQKLHRQFKGDWLLALAAYNAGEGKISRVVKQFKRTHPGERVTFWRLNLPAQTMRYIPKLFAYKEVLSHSKRYRFRLPTIPNKPHLVQVRVNKALNLRMVASRAGLPQSLLTDLNPYFLKGRTRPRQSNRITLPRRYASRIKKAIRTLAPTYANHGKTARQRYANQKDRTPKTHYTVRKGQNLPKVVKLKVYKRNSG